MYCYKVMIHPNNKQETKIRRTMNKVIECNQIVFDYLDSFIKNKLPFPKCSDVRKWFTVQKTIKDNELISKRNGMTKREMRESNLDTLFYDVSNDALKQEIKDTYNAFMRFFKKESKYPVRKKYKSYHKGFYVDPYKIKFTDRKVRLEKIANNQKKNRQILNWISFAERDRIPTNIPYQNPRVVLDGDEFFIVVSVDDEFAPKKKITSIKDKVIGIDLNIKAFVTSDNDRYTSITKTKAYKKNKKKLHRIQRSLSRMDLMNKTTKKHTRNYYKKNKIKRMYEKRKNNLKDAHISYIIEDIISKRPERVIVETLDVKEMKESYNKKKKLKLEVDSKEKYIAKGIQENPFSRFLKALEYRLYKAGIQFIKIDKWDPSSKTCHVCKYKKNDLKLSDRVFICPKCGLTIDRDYNAAINIKNYGLAM